MPIRGLGTIEENPAALFRRAGLQARKSIRLSQSVHLRQDGPKRAGTWCSLQRDRALVGNHQRQRKIPARGAIRRPAHWKGPTAQAAVRQARIRLSTPHRPWPSLALRRLTGESEELGFAPARSSFGLLQIACGSEDLLIAT